jgi:serine acetyltransferase
VKFIRYLFQDWSANKGNIKGQIFLFSFRVASYLRRSHAIIVFFSFPYFLFHRIFFEWILGIELPWKTRVGHGAVLFHGVGLVVNDRAIIGSNVVLRHCTTIGVGVTGPLGEGAAPIIGSNVDIGCNVCIIGGVTVGENSVIGAGSVVVSDIPPYSVAVGNPARVIKRVMPSGEGNA